MVVFTSPLLPLGAPGSPFFIGRYFLPLSESSGTVTALAQVLNLDIAETQEELRTLPLDQRQHPGNFRGPL